jgi:hypothetical protein
VTGRYEARGHKAEREATGSAHARQDARSAAL